MGMRVFISSVRRGLGPERDNLPGLVLALGHEPVAYEGISAQDVPSREACLRAVQSADVVLLVLGTHYGQRMPDTGKSPTEEEWSVAVDAGKPVFVLRKTGVETVDPDQQTFITKLGNYATGRFWTTFTTIEELNSEVRRVLEQAAARPASLSYEPLHPPALVAWRPTTSPHQVNTGGPLLEVHILALNVPRLSGRLLATLPTRVVEVLRQTNAAPATSALTPLHDNDGVTVTVDSGAPHGPWDQPRPRALHAVRVTADGDTAVLTALPRDRTGPVLDPTDLTAAISEALRLGAALLPPAHRVAIAVGLAPLLMITEGDVRQLQGRSGARTIKSSDSIHLEPDESTNASALTDSNIELASNLATRLTTTFRNAR